MCSTKLLLHVRILNRILIFAVLASVMDTFQVQEWRKIFPSCLIGCSERTSRKYDTILEMAQGRSSVFYYVNKKCRSRLQLGSG